MKKLIGLCLLSAAWTTGAVSSVHAQSIDARQLMQATNEDRAQHGLGPLKWDPALARAAQSHAELMVRQGALSHQYAGNPPWRRASHATARTFAWLRKIWRSHRHPAHWRQSGCTRRLIGEIFWTPG